MHLIRALHYATLQPIQITIVNQQLHSIIPLQCDADEARSLPIAAPGLFDIQINGYHGLWFCSSSLTVESVHKIVRSLAERGIPRFFPTLITCSFESMLHGVATIRQACQQDKITQLAIRGIHLEGPYISSEDGPRGAHPGQYIRPASFAEFLQWQAKSGNLIKLVTLAPEVEGAIGFIQAAVATGVRISIGHTAATPDQISQAVQAGASLSTHLGNACKATMNRHRNIFWPQLANNSLTASVIADGHHLPVEMLQAIIRCKTLDRTILTCDVSGFGGCPPGRYAASDVAVEVLEDGRIVVADQREFLAGSGATTGDCVAFAMSSCQLPLADAWHLASLRPAAIFGEPACLLATSQPATLTLFQLTHGGHSAESKPSDHNDKFPIQFHPVASYAHGVCLTD